MEIVGILKVVGWSAVALVVVGWLVVSFSKQGRLRAVVERWSASFLFVALLCLFLSLLNRAWQNDSTIGLVAFGFLAFLFSISLLVSLVQAVQATARADAAAPGPSVIH